MRLTALLCKKRYVIHGHRWIGKHRLPHKINPWNVLSMEKRLEIEDKNMFYCRHPYLTKEQEFGAMRELQKGEKWLAQAKTTKAATKVQVSVRVEERLAHLNHHNVWEI